MDLQLRGPEGVQARIRQIQSRIATITGHPFGDDLKSASTEISGTIGSGNTPFNPFGPSSSVKASAPDFLKPMISKAARQAGVDEDLFNALVAAESSYNVNARSFVGAMGLTQLMPSTAQALGISNPFDPEENLNGGAKYLAQMITKFGDARLALAAYNAGPAAVEKYGGIPPFPETQKYVEKIMGLAGAGKP